MQALSAWRRGWLAFKELQVRRFMSKA